MADSVVPVDALAQDLLGPALVAKLKQEFRDRDKKKFGYVDPADVAVILRSQKFCPTEAQIREFARTCPSNQAGLNQLLSFACKVGLPHFRKEELSEFFEPFDMGIAAGRHEGRIKEKCFRNLLINVGDTEFDEVEVDDLLSELAIEGCYEEGQGVNYDKFLDLMLREVAT